MGRNFLLYLFLVGAFASLMNNGLGGTDSATFRENANTSIPEEVSSSSGSDSESSTMGQGNAVALDRSADGHFYADVEVNGQRINFLVDTGASVIALSRDDARRAGLAPSISMPEVVGEGASGEVRGEVVSLDRVALGSTTASDLPAIVLDSGSQSLLGQSFLSSFDSVEIRDDRMILQ